jgi:hypothetical protein
MEPLVDTRVNRFFVVIWIVGMLSCRPAVLSRLESTLLTVELDVFSGQPNPRWELTDDQASEFVTILRRLPTTQASQASQASPEGLGYRGFVLRPGNKSGESFDEIRVYRGLAVTRHVGRADVFSDRERLLERWLAGSARGHVSDSVLSLIEREIAEQ